MYTEGLQIGDSSYLLQDESNELVLATIEGTSQQMEEYIQMVNQYDKNREEISSLIDRLSEINSKDKNAKIVNIGMILMTIGIEGLFLILKFVDSSFPVEVFMSIPAIGCSVGIITSSACYGTKKKRKCEKKKIGEEYLEKEKEQMKLKNKINILEHQIEYSETKMSDDKTITVTTVENKKASVKTRVLRLNQSR